MTLMFRCPRCMIPQALGPNLLAPSETGLWVECPACGTVAEHWPHPCLRPALREFAQSCVEADAEIAAGMLVRVEG